MKKIPVSCGKKRKFKPGPIRAHRAPTGTFSFLLPPRTVTRRDNPPGRHRRCSAPPKSQLAAATSFDR